MSIPLKMSVSNVVKILRAKTYLHMREKFSFLDKIYSGQEVLVTLYPVSMCGISELTVKIYRDAEQTRQLTNST